MEKNNIYLEHLKNSRELALGSQLRQSPPFKIYRRFRYRDRVVRVDVLGDPRPSAASGEVQLLGVWYDDFPHGMPLEFLERTLGKWRMIASDYAPFETALVTKYADSIYVYSNYQNLRLDFLMNENGGKVCVAAHKISKVFDLCSAQPAILSIYPNLGQIQIVIKNLDTVEKVELPHVALLPSRVAYGLKDREWLERQAKAPQPVSVNNPAWRGILSSARELFDNIYLLPDELDRERAEYYARLFADAGVPAIVIQGFPGTFHHLVQAIRRVAPHIPVYVIYHGNFGQMRDDYEWSVFQQIVHLNLNGNVAKVGFVKQGMAEIMSTMGMRAAFIMNIVRRIPEAPSTPPAEGVHIAIWSEPDWGWRKPPYTMLAALRRIEGAVGHVYNVSPRAGEFGNLLALNADYMTRAIPQEAVTKAMAQMHLNLYVTLSECAPMVPLESLSVGSPCLLGPTSHYFRDHEYLYSRLVVPYPDNPEAIAEKANLALVERSQVIQAYQLYAPEYNQRARAALAEFVEFPI
jgi:hypothetical protein